MSRDIAVWSGWARGQTPDAVGPKHTMHSFVTVSSRCLQKNNNGAFTSPLSRCGRRDRASTTPRAFRGDRVTTHAHRDWPENTCESTTTRSGRLAVYPREWYCIGHHKCPSTPVFPFSFSSARSYSPWAVAMAVDLANREIPAYPRPDARVASDPCR